MEWVFRGLAGLLRGISRGRSPREIQPSSFTWINPIYLHLYFNILSSLAVNSILLLYFYFPGHTLSHPLNDHLSFLQQSNAFRILKIKTWNTFNQNIFHISFVIKLSNKNIYWTSSQFIALVFRAGTAKIWAWWTPMKEKTRLSIQSWKPTFLVSETYFQANGITLKLF